MKARIIMRMAAVWGALGVAMVASAEPVGKAYTLEDSIRIGLARAVRVQNAGRDQLIARARVRQAGAQALPQLGVTAGYTRMDELQEFDFNGTSVELGTLDNYAAQGEVSQLLYSGGKVRAAMRAARLSERYAREGRGITEAELVRDIRTGFNDILLARSAVRVHEESVKQLERLLEQTEQKARSGTASEFDLLAAKVRLANAKPDWIRAQSAYELAIESFRALVNLEDGSFELQGDLTYEPRECVLDLLLDAAITNRAELRQMETTLALMEQDVVAAKGDYQPSVTATFDYKGANSQGFVSMNDEWEWHWSAGVGLRWDLWDGGLRSGVVREKALRLEKMKADYEELTRAVRLQVRQAYLELEHARQAVEAGGDSVGLAERALEIAGARHQSGLSTYLEFTDANLALSTARLSQSQALCDHMNAKARLTFAVGQRDW